MPHRTVRYLPSGRASDKRAALPSHALQRTALRQFAVLEEVGERFGELVEVDQEGVVAMG
jgi:hypothetical protein